MNNSQSNRSIKRSPEVVVYKGPPKKKVKQNPGSSVDKHDDGEQQYNLSNSKKSDVISMKQARFEVHKFGIKGFHKEKKEEANVQLAISLGAKPLKKKYYNYKEYIEKRKEEIMIAREQRMQKAKNNRLKSRKSSNKKNKSNKRRKR